MNGNLKISSMLLHSLSKAIQNLNESDTHEILEGNFKVDIVINKRDVKTGKESNKIKKILSSNDLGAITKKLSEIEDRNSGFSILETQCETKDSLIQLARHIDLPIHKNDTTDRLREKIIEATIGYKLRSKAIQG